MHPGPGVGFADPHLFGDLSVGELLDLPQDEGHPVGLRQRIHRFLHGPLLLEVSDFFVGGRRFVPLGPEAVDHAKLGGVTGAGIGADVGEYSTQPGVEVVLAPEPVES
jgi:hypothetical protein